MEKVRLDVLLTERGLAESRSLAQRLVMAGQVRVDGQVVLKPATRFPADSAIQVDRGPRYVSRGGEKLEAALEAFGLAELGGRVCADVGASTGGFTDCLLQHGAGKVYAVDVGYGELHWKLRNDPRVVVMERTNARYLEGFPEPVALVTIDASFISLRILLPVVRGWLAEGDAETRGRGDVETRGQEDAGTRRRGDAETRGRGDGASGDAEMRGGDSSLSTERSSDDAAERGGEVVALIKPQFEAGRAEVSRGDGVIQDPEIHRRVLAEIVDFARGEGFGIRGLIRSPLKGPKGNVEFLIHLGYPAGAGEAEVGDLIDRAMTIEEE